VGRRFVKALRYFIPLTVVITAFCGLTYAAVQQSYRQNANDPQIQIAEDSAAQLNQGATPKEIVPLDQVDMAKSLASFLIIFDKNGKVVDSNVQLDGKIPTPPPGVFDYVSSGGQRSIGSLKKKLIFKLEGGSEQNRVTWEPRENVRIAAVIAKYNDGFVLVGRNMREVEIREENLSHMVFAAWIVTLGATFVATALLI